MVFRPAFPNRFGPGTAIDEVLNQGWPAPIPPRIWTGDTASAKLLLPGQLQAVASAVAVKGVPVARRKIPFNCQFPKMVPATPPFRNRFPRPNGSSYRWLAVIMWVRSKLDGPYWRFKSR